MPTINPFIHGLSFGAWIAGGTEASFPIASFRKRAQNPFESALSHVWSLVCDTSYLNYNESCCWMDVSGIGEAKAKVFRSGCWGPLAIWGIVPRRPCGHADETAPRPHCRRRNLPAGVRRAFPCPGSCPAWGCRPSNPGQGPPVSPLRRSVSLSGLVSFPG